MENFELQKPRMVPDLGPDNTDDKYIKAVRDKLEPGSAAEDCLNELVDHVCDVMEHWCRIVGMQRGDDMRDFPNVLRRLMGDGEPIAWIIEQEGRSPIMCHEAGVAAELSTRPGYFVTPYVSKVPK